MYFAIIYEFFLRLPHSRWRYLKWRFCHDFIERKFMKKLLRNFKNNFCKMMLQISRKILHWCLIVIQPAATFNTFNSTTQTCRSSFSFTLKIFIPLTFCHRIIFQNNNKKMLRRKNVSRHKIWMTVRVYITIFKLISCLSYYTHNGNKFDFK